MHINVQFQNLHASAENFKVLNYFKIFRDG